MTYDFNSNKRISDAEHAWSEFSFAVDQVIYNHDREKPNLNCGYAIYKDIKWCFESRARAIILKHEFESSYGWSRRLVRA